MVPRWKPKLKIDLDQLVDRVRSDGFWRDRVSAASAPSSAIGLHLATFVEPFLTLVLEGRKTTDSRLARKRCAPFGQVREGDIILIKKVAGPICGIALANRTVYIDLAREPLAHLRVRYGETICADDTFWDSRRDAAYATLIELAHATKIEPLMCHKRDRRAWVSLRSPQLPLVT